MDPERLQDDNGYDKKYDVSDQEKKLEDAVKKTTHNLALFWLKVLILSKYLIPFSIRLSIPLYWKDLLLYWFIESHIPE